MLILSISGPSGVGKTTIIKKLEQKNFIRVTPSTTRPIRQGEFCDNYRFLSLKDYEQKLNNNEMKISLLFFDNYYGYQITDINNSLKTQKIPILEIYTKFIPVFKSCFNDSYSIFLLPENILMLENRMIQRFDSQASILKRMKEVEEEISFYQENHHFFDQCIIIKSNYNQEIVELKILEALNNVL